MKKLLFILMLLFSICSFAQNVQTVYCEIIGSGNFSGNNIKISFDFGTEGFSYKASEENQIVNEKGKLIQFSSMVEALNYMAARGWKLHTAFSAAVKGMGAQETYRYILCKELLEGQSGMDGITLFREYKVQKREKAEEEEMRKGTWDDIYK